MAPEAAVERPTGSTLVVADLHLDRSRPATVGFAATVFADAHRHSALWILGDLFEYWIGDDMPTDGLEPAIAALTGLVDAGTGVHLLHGNRDFMLGDDFAARIGATLHREDELVVELAGQPTLLLHGDTLCTDDVDYLRLRATVRDRAWQAGMLEHGPEERLRIAAGFRADSGNATARKSEPIMDVAIDTVGARFEASGAARMIHGHTHRPAVHSGEGVDAHRNEKVDERLRLVLGDWRADRAVVAIADSASVKLVELRSAGGGGAPRAYPFPA